MTALLEADQITVRFGGVIANDEVTLRVDEGERVGLIGPNGAGKTTFIDALCGFVPASGRVTVAGRDVSGAKAAGRARAGLVRTWQSVELFDDLSIADNLAVAAHHARRFDLVRDLLGRRPAPAVDHVTAALARVGLDDKADAFPDELSHGQRKLAGVARALVSRPRVLCLDEPAAGLDEQESAALAAQLRGLSDEGFTTVLVDHDMGLVFGVCDRIVVLDTGRVIASGTPAEIRANARVLDAYLGTGRTEGS